MKAQLAKVPPTELALEYLPAVQPCGRKPLLLIHGWGNTRTCWQPLLPWLTQQQEVYRLDLPGFGNSAHCSLPDLNEALAALGRLLPDRCILLGWSLGGNLALRLATQYPGKIAAVATLATNASFVANAVWPDAMPPATFRDFSRQFSAAPAVTLKRFCALQAQGDAQGGALLKSLRSQCTPPAPEQEAQWQHSLDWLAQLDHRDELQRLAIPALHLFGEQDALIPASAAKAMETISPGEIDVFPMAGHAFHLSHTQAVAQRLQTFLDSLDAHSPRIDKHRMARSFSRAAATYDSAAHVQTHAGHTLLEYLPTILLTEPLLDLGCGTGFCTQHLMDRGAQVTALDIAPGMLHKARQKLPQKTDWVCADAEQLPFAGESFTSVVSNLTLQWSEQLPQLFGGLTNVLKPDGWLLFSTLGPATLHELRTAWSRADDYTHINNFVPANKLRTLLTAAGFHIEIFEEEEIVPRYRQVNELMQELKALGAHNVNAQQNNGLTGPSHLRRVSRAYEQFRGSDGKLPATYQIIYVLARRHSRTGTRKEYRTMTLPGDLG